MRSEASWKIVEELNIDDAAGEERVDGVVLRWRALTMRPIDLVS